jgi:isoleucyl-tRNA synthetase
VEQTAFYFDNRKDALYCDPFSSVKRRATRTVMNELFRCLTTWWAPILVFTTEEVWMNRQHTEHAASAVHPQTELSVHLQQFAAPAEIAGGADLEKKWEGIRKVRRVVTGALEKERANKVIGSSLEASPEVWLQLPAAEIEALRSVDFAEICITSGITLHAAPGPADAFRLDDVGQVQVMPKKAFGAKCARSWKISPDIGSDQEFPDITARDAEAVREWQKRTGKVV